MILSKRKRVKLRSILQKSTSLFLTAVIILQISWPTQAFALTGGPSQPEVQSFEPIATSDMVDLFTGDFNYNIPLLDVEGYPINIAYHSGITNDQEASWVGLGWNINPGVINRNMRGLPDDFCGELVTKYQNMKPNKTWGVAIDAGVEIFGLGLKLGSQYGFNFNNYTGPSVVQSANVGLSSGVGGAGKLTAGLGLTSSSDEGLTVQPSLSFSTKLSVGEATSLNLGLSVGSTFNSRAGLKQLTIGASASMSLNQMGEDGKRVGDGGTQMPGGINATAVFDFTQPTYIPRVEMPLKNYSMSGHMTFGGELWGTYFSGGLSGFYSAQELAQKTISNRAYGYLYAEKGTFDDNALMDFNREKDGAFTETTASLPLTNFTFDTYGVTGQGISGSYRPYRGDIGYVFDPASYTTSDNGALTVEVGLGGYVHVGTDLTVTDVDTKSGKWKNDNSALQRMIHTVKSSGNDFENVYFKEANEKTVDSDPAFYEIAGEDRPARFEANFGKFDHNINSVFITDNGKRLSFSAPIRRKARDKKTQTISFLKKSEYNDYALEVIPNLSPGAKNNHIAEITTLGNDGSRYVYGIAAYNLFSKESTFSVGSTDISSHNNAGSLAASHINGLVAYSGFDNTQANDKGMDNWYSSTETPAYAHSYLLTSVLTPDYIDSDNIRGPSDGDFGGYTKFRYSKDSIFNWRIPFEYNQGTLAEGLKSDFQDDKANILYGQKELWYMDSVITKNYIAIFHKSGRRDGLGVLNGNGTMDSTVKLKRLDSISLYSKHDLATPLKRVHFEYTYDLCPGVPNTTDTASGGKLTLKKIYFTYQNSHKARLSPYVFDYHETDPSENPTYNIKAYDRWGNYKPNNATTLGILGGGDASLFIGTSNMPPSDYPYTIQDTTLTNKYVAVWNLKEINLPSGGTIKVRYESDDYAYVQNKKAGQMFKIINYDNPVDSTGKLVDFTTGGGKFFFKLHNGVTDVSKYLKDQYYIYFRFLVNIKTFAGQPRLEYVSGYGELDSYGTQSGFGWLKLRDVRLKDDGTGSLVNPIVRDAINFGRLHLPKIVWDAASGNFSGTLSLSILTALINSSFIKNIRDAIVGPNEALFTKYDVAHQFVAGKSWMRLVNPDGHKLGGGLRVKKIEMSDNWLDMVGSGNGETSNYGQEYSYNLPDGTSSGVAAYEPQIGGDENSLKYPHFSSTKKLLVPDDRSYMEEPFGESFYPSPSVGYSMVTVKNISRAGVSRHATGKVVHEFYTAKDFPTIATRTNIFQKRGKDSPTSLRSLFKINTRDYMSATQGFAIELNDMHGKPKSEKVYQENQLLPITSVEYKYKSDPYKNGSFKLNNSCTVIEKNGDVSTKNIGLNFDMVGDFRESNSNTRAITLQINIDVVPFLGYPAVFPSMWPGFAKDKTRFRSATTTKVVQRFGILEETIYKDLGSTVSNKNLAYDAETGDLLLTQSKTDFNDPLYSFKYPAWWYYENMGPAYQNIGYELNNLNFAWGVATTGSQTYMFREGDVLALTGTGMRAWVTEVGTSTIKIMTKTGSLVNGTHNIKVLASGNKNNLVTEMAKITTLSNPLNSLKSNTYEKIIEATAVEFSNKRKAPCNCMASASSNVVSSSNPYVIGTKGVWRPLKSYTHLTSRSQSNTNNNTNIRNDGIYESYTPLYALQSGEWRMDTKDWTYINEVTEFNVFGQEVENKDALNRYSSATYGYNQTIPLSLATNAMHKEQGFDGFEDYAFNPCIDDHFKFGIADTISTKSHTGRYSYKVPSGTSRSLSKQINVACADTSAECKVDLGIGHLAAPYPRPSKTVVEAILGTAPYSYSWTFISGSPPYTLYPSGLELTNSSAYIIEVTVVDAKGCTKTVKLTN